MGRYSWSRSGRSSSCLAACLREKPLGGKRSKVVREDGEGMMDQKEAKTDLLDDGQDPRLARSVSVSSNTCCRPSSQDVSDPRDEKRGKPGEGTARKDGPRLILLSSLSAL